MLKKGVLITFIYSIHFVLYIKICYGIPFYRKNLRRETLKDPPTRFKLKSISCHFRTNCASLGKYLYARIIIKK